MGGEASGGLASPCRGGAGGGGASTGATRDTPKAPHLEEVGYHVDVGPCGRHEHAEGKAGIDPLQVLLGGGRAADEGAAMRPTQPPVSPPASAQPA